MLLKLCKQLYSYPTLDAKDFALINSTQVWILDQILYSAVILRSYQQGRIQQGGWHEWPKQGNKRYKGMGVPLVNFYYTCTGCQLL